MSDSKSDSNPPIVVNALFSVAGGTLGRTAKVVCKYVDMDDGEKVPVFGIRKRDYWLFGPFLPSKMTEAIRDAVSAAVKNLQLKFRKEVVARRKERLQMEFEKDIAELEAADAGRKELDISDTESESDHGSDAAPTELEDEAAEGDKAASAHKSRAKPKAKYHMKGPVMWTHVEVCGKKFAIAENGHLNGLNIRATNQSIQDAIALFHKELTKVIEDNPSSASGVAGHGSKSEKLSWKQKQAADKAALAMPKAAAAEQADAAAQECAEDGKMYTIRGLVGWRNSDKSFMIWYKKSDGTRTQTQKGLAVKTTKKVGGNEVSLKRKEFIKEKRLVFKKAIKLWNESDCSKRPRLSEEGVVSVPGC